MCGIYGYIGTPKNPAAVYGMLKILAVATEVRGIHSTGFVAVNDSDYYHERRLVRAAHFFREVDVESVIKKDCYFFLGHNRWASVGEILVENAHPFKGDKYFLAHNGTCHDAVRLMKMAGLKTKGTTDSEALLVLTEAFGRGALRRFSNLSVVMVDYMSAEENMLFYRDAYNPMCYCDLRDVLGVVYIS